MSEKFLKNSIILTSAEEIERQIRAFAPYPGAYAVFRQKKVKVLKARVYQSGEKWKAGQVLGYDRKKGLLVGTGDGILMIEELQPENKKTQSSQEFCCGYRIQPGDEFH